MQVKILKNELSKRMDKNPHYSLRAFAASLNINPGTLSAIINRKRIFSDKLVNKLVDKLPLSQKERDSFLKNSNLQSCLNRKNPHEQKTQEIENQFFHFLEDWKHLAAIELVAFDDFIPNSKYFAKKLKITLTRASLILERIFFLGLLKQNESKKWKKNRPFIKTKDRGKTSSILKKLQIDFRHKAIESIENDPIEERHMTGMTFAINSQKVEEAKKCIDRFAEDMSDFLVESPCDSIYQLNISLFPLIKNLNQNKFDNNKENTNEH